MPDYELFKNEATTTVAANASSSVTSISVASSVGFPTPVAGTSQFRVRIGNEFLIVTAVSGTTWTVTRGAEGSTAAALTVGQVVEHVVTAGALDSKVSGFNVTKIYKLTQAQYDAIGTKDSATLYVIVG